MSQYASRLTIIVKDVSAWKKICEENYWEDYGIYISSDYDEKTYSTFEACLFEDELESIAYELKECLGKDVLLISDTTNINVDDFTYCVYLINGNITSIYFGEGRKAAMSYKTKIDDIAGWLKYGGFKFTEEDVEWLKSFGIEGVKMKTSKKK